MTDKTRPAEVAGTGEADGSPCECVNWCEIDNTHRFLTGHHEGCPHTPKALGKALELIAALARGMELWGAEEDGIYDGAWEAYRKAKALQGMFLPPANNGVTGAGGVP
jgi:hypothetical protein